MLTASCFAGNGGLVSASQPARHTMLLLLALLLISDGVGTAHCSTVPGNSTDMLSLLDFKRDITNDPRQALSSWNASTPHCKWEGVNCSLTHPGRVTVLNLTEQGLSGSISPSLGNLTFLETLDLSTNSFTDELPPLNRLHRLQKLWLSENSLQGIIPATLTNCSNLNSLYLSGNSLIGEIPLNIGLLSNLSELQLAKNNLTGMIPPSLKNISQLEVINLADNQLMGSIPDKIGQFPSLLGLLLGGNMLSGRIPTTLLNQSYLQILDVGFNMIGNTSPSAAEEELEQWHMQAHIDQSKVSFSKALTVEAWHFLRHKFMFRISWLTLVALPVSPLYSYCYWWWSINYINLFFYYTNTWYNKIAKYYQ